MNKPRQLKVVGAGDTKLGRPTIMDRALAARWGAPYVHLAVFAIDVDRVHQLEEPSLPFAWEVYLTELRLARLVAEATHDPMQMVEDVTLAILDLPRPRGGKLPPLGSQLPFAVYTAVGHGILPNKLGSCFQVWKKPPVDLLEDVSKLAAQQGLSARLARHCLDVALSPPLAPPTRETLEQLAEDQRVSSQ
jgi:hypothetical protein